MTRDNAILKIRAFVREHAGIDADPDWIIRKTNYWRACYGAPHFFEKEIAAGAVIDGGELFLDLNDDTGVVTIFP